VVWVDAAALSRRLILLLPAAFDPLQCQAVRWIKNMEAHAGLRVMSITASDMLRQLESAVQFGQPVLLVDVLEVIDPVLEPLLAKAYVR
jgi:dynein heavy chain